MKKRLLAALLGVSLLLTGCDGKKMITIKNAGLEEVYNRVVKISILKNYKITYQDPAFEVLTVEFKRTYKQGSEYTRYTKFGRVTTHSADEYDVETGSFEFQKAGKNVKIVVTWDGTTIGPFGPESKINEIIKDLQRFYSVTVVDAKE